MFKIATHSEKMQVEDPPVVFSSFRPVSPISAPQKKLATPIEAPVLADEDMDAVCAKLPKQLQLGDAIWHSKGGSGEDFWDRDFEVKEQRCYNEVNEEGVLQSPSWSPVSPVFPSQSASAAEKFTTPQIIETQHSAPSYNQATEPVLNAWLGTNVIMEAEWTIEPSVELLKDAIGRRAETEAATYANPYDPEGWLRLTNIYFELCFNDLQVASAHKAIYLINQGLDLTDRRVGQRVREIVGLRLSCPLMIVVRDELESGLAEAYRSLLRGLLEMSAYWDGLKEAKRALEIFPGNQDFLLLQRMMEEESQMRATALEESKQPAEDITQLTRVGRSYKRKYPWLEEKLFTRSTSFLGEINSTFNATNCEVRPLSVTKKDSGTRKRQISHNLAMRISKKPFRKLAVDKETDIGPLGVFAKRIIHKDEIILTDHNLTVVPIKPPKKLQHCDACHALLVPPFLGNGEVRRPPCCRAVAYCSQECASAALNGYHKVLCGQDFKWLYKSAASKELDASWQPAALLRILAIVVSDLKADPTAKTHPLQHPLLARLTAGYESDASEAKEQVWNYFSHVIAPTRILAQLGVDVFADARWSAEVIHCIYWRVLNNACRTASCTVVDGKLEKTMLSGIGPGYVLFNHSCAESVAWMAAGSLEGTARIGAAGGSTLGKRTRTSDEDAGDEGKVKVGCNALLCVATREIKEGEEARISYLPPRKRQQLGRWFDGGKCICGACDGSLIETS